MAILGTIVFVIFKSLGGIKDTYMFALVTGLAAIIFGLLVNAVYMMFLKPQRLPFPSGR